MAPLRLPAVKQEITSIALTQASAFAETILGKADETEVHAMLRSGWKKDT